jgi:hypothetical protein
MKIVWTEIRWLLPGVVLLVLIAGALFFSYRQRAEMSLRLRWLAASLKWLGFAFLLGFILRPEVIRSFNRPGTNHWAILSDNSRSMTIQDQRDGKSRADRFAQLIDPKKTTWQTELEKQFLVDRFSFDSRLHRQVENVPLPFDGSASGLFQSLAALRERYDGRPLAGVLVLTDGSPTDRLSSDELKKLPPVFPLVIAPEKPLTDLSIPTASAQVTLFEDAPVMVDATISATGLNGQMIIATVKENGTTLGEQRRVISNASETWSARFQVRPKETGTSFLDMEVKVENSAGVTEATLENNHRMVAANREKGPYRVLYFAGRPNYEHKYLQRALEGDSDVGVTSLLRIAKREPKFDYRSREGERSNPLYRGFEVQDEAERFDEAVFIRLNTKDANELRAGFPRTAEEIFPFEAMIIDDVEAAFFDHEQQRLLQRFVSERGGGVIMLGGAESLDTGGFAGTPVGEMLPVYLDPATPPGKALSGKFELTREGKLEPWARLRETESDEATRLSRMPEFKSVHRLAPLRPGSTTIGELNISGKASPALATRRYGRGHTAVLGIGDLWRWGLKSPEGRVDLDKTWRQTLRWLLADVPRRLTVKAESDPQAARGSLLTVELLGKDFHPDESASVVLRVRRPDGNWTTVSPRPHPSQPGVLQATFAAGEPGPYLAEATTRAAENQPALTARTGWVVNALQDEYKSLVPDMEAMNQLAAQTGGRVIAVDGLADFVASLKNLPVPVSETRSEPLWNSPLWLVIALACFIGEWALRRWKKLT